MENNTYVINEKKGTITYCLTYNGDKFFGIARCNSSDEFSASKGIKIAKVRATLQIRKQVISELQGNLERLQYSFEPSYYPPSIRRLKAKAIDDCNQTLKIEREYKKRDEQYLKELCLG